MISTIYVLMQPVNSLSLMAVNVVVMNPDAPEICAELIRNEGYSFEYDINKDGYLTADDYNAVYDIFYGKYDEWHSGERQADIRALVRIKKCISGLVPADMNFDLDNDGVISEQDAAVCRRWLLMGKTERERF